MKMRILDARSLPPFVQEHVRFQAVGAVLGGRAPGEVARHFGITRQAVHKWLKAHSLGGFESLRARPQGRPRQEGTPCA
jgi:transposase-like protein